MNTTEQIHIDTDAIEMHQRISVEINTDYYAELAGFLIEITGNSNVLKSDVCLENDQLKGLKIIIEAKVRFMLIHWITHIENMTLHSIPMSDADFLDTFGWGINEWLFDHRDVKINFPFASATSKVQFFAETNPLFLGCEQGGHYYLFNYNGYT